MSEPTGFLSVCYTAESSVTYRKPVGSNDGTSKKNCDLKNKSW